MSLKKLIGAAALSLFATVAIAQDKTGWPESFTVGTASQGGTYFAYGSGWANLRCRASSAFPVRGEVTGGPMQNMALVHTGEAAVRHDHDGSGSESIEGTNPIAPGLQMTNACAMFPMYQTPFGITRCRPRASPRSPKFPTARESASVRRAPPRTPTSPRMMESLGVKFERRNGGWTDLGGQLQDGLLDVIAFAAGVPDTGGVPAGSADRK